MPTASPQVSVEQSLGWQLLRYKVNDILEDNALELAEILNETHHEAQRKIASVLDHYHFHSSGYPESLDRGLFSFIVHLTQPFRIPAMTTRFSWVLEYLHTNMPQGSVLEYGGGGGKDSIIFAKRGYNVSFSDFLDKSITPLILARFGIRGLSISSKDVRDIGESRYDIINCVDVIEHVYDVEYVVADIVAHLVAGGLFICAPSFFNSWNGDHVEKNCGYNHYFVNMLQSIGLRVIEINDGLHLYRNERRVGQSVVEDRKILREQLYRLSLRLSLQSALKYACALPAVLLGIQLLVRDEMKRKSYREIAVSRAIDNFAIWRLSHHRLHFDLEKR